MRGGVSGDRGWMDRQQILSLVGGRWNFCSLTLVCMQFKDEWWHLYYVNILKKQIVDYLRMQRKIKLLIFNGDVHDLHIWIWVFFCCNSCHSFWAFSLIDLRVSSNSFSFNSLVANLCFKLSTYFSLMEIPSGLKLWSMLTLYKGKFPPFNHSFL